MLALGSHKRLDRPRCCADREGGVERPSQPLSRLVGARLDILIANAGVCEAALIEDAAVEDCDELLAINVRAPYFLVQQVLPSIRRGGPRPSQRPCQWNCSLGHRGRQVQCHQERTETYLHPGYTVLAAWRIAG